MFTENQNTTHEVPWESVGFDRVWPLGGTDYDEIARKKLEEMTQALEEGKKSDSVLIGARPSDE